MKATIPPETVYTFESQSRQFPRLGKPWITRLQVDASLTEAREEMLPDPVIDMLVYRSDDRLMRGVIYYYVVDSEPWEKAGNVNLFIDSSWQRRGIGTLLLRRMMTLHPINFEAQRYTPAGLSLVKKVTS